MTCGPAPWHQASMRFALVRRGRTCPELRGEWVFQVAGLKISMERPKTRDLEKWQNIFVLARPSSFLCFLVARLDFAKNGLLKIDEFSLKPTENVVPNCRGSKTHFGALGSGTSHVKSGSNMVPKYFSLNWRFLVHSPSRRQGELFHFLAFSLLEHRSLFIVFMVAFCSAITTSIFPFVLFHFVVFAGCVCFFVGVSASDSTSSFLSLF